MQNPTNKEERRTLVKEELVFECPQLFSHTDSLSGKYSGFFPLFFSPSQKSDGKEAINKNNTKSPLFFLFLRVAAVRGGGGAGQGRAGWLAGSGSVAGEKNTQIGKQKKRLSAREEEEEQQQSNAVSEKYKYCPDPRSWHQLNKTRIFFSK